MALIKATSDGKLEVSGRCFENETIKILEGERPKCATTAAKRACFVMRFLTTLVDKLVGASDDSDPPRSDRRVHGWCDPRRALLGVRGCFSESKRVSPTDFAKEMQVRRSRHFINGLAAVSRCETAHVGA